MTEIVVKQVVTKVVVGTDTVIKVGVRPSNTVAEQVGTPIRETVKVVSPIAVVAKPTTEVTRTVEVGIPGPAGPAGPAGGTSIQRIAAQALGGHRIVRSISAAAVDYASSDQPTHGDDTLGITNGAVAAGAAADIITTGPITFNGWAWTPLQPVFVGLNGLPTQTAPSTGFMQEIGYAEDSTTIFIRVEPPTYIED